MIKKNHTRKAHFRVTLDGEQRKIENVTVMSADEHKRTHTHTAHIRTTSSGTNTILKKQ